MEDKYKLFLDSIDERWVDFINEVNTYLMEAGCKCDIKEAKSGYAVSYKLNKKALVNFVHRKTGIKIRIYAKNIAKYQDFLNTLPKKMKEDIKKSSDCKSCSSKCEEGYNFILDGGQYKKCKYAVCFLPLSEENNPYIMELIKNEIKNGGTYDG
ncbi:hypothetical protein FMM68_06965 [Lachnospiraceae bacterium MD329]|nr:hypothetical protein [Lachnospiraceae bacterium MD329]